MDYFKVSVCIVTYNQKDFVYQCLESLLDQKTNFDYEILIADDFSTDGTREILKNLSTRIRKRLSCTCKRKI